MNHKLSHIDASGNASMVDVSKKNSTERVAIASGKVVFPASVFETLANQDFLAGIQAVKKTSDLIPLCHQLLLSKISIDIQPVGTNLEIKCTVKCTERTGVEMEALTGVSVSALTIYDMCKALSQDIIISDIQLEKKTGGKHDFSR